MCAHLADRNFYQMDGIVPLAKPAGPSSAQCLYAFKKYGQKKIGHAGTLDPMASGVLIALLGQATKLSSWLLQAGEKIYSGLIRLGIETDTWDIQGNIINEKPVRDIGSERLETEIMAWLELEDQEVPAYSAAKYNGQPLYKLARKGHDIPVKRKGVHIFKAEMLTLDLPFVSFRVTTSSGAYIRSLAHSLGMRLGCGACLQELTREYSHPFNLGQCISLDEIGAGLIPEHILPLQAALPEWPSIELEAVDAVRVRNGNPVLAKTHPSSKNAFLCVEGKPLAIATFSEGRWLIERGLWST